MNTNRRSSGYFSTNQVNFDHSLGATGGEDTVVDERGQFEDLVQNSTPTSKNSSYDLPGLNHSLIVMIFFGGPRPGLEGLAQQDRYITESPVITHRDTTWILAVKILLASRRFVTQTNRTLKMQAYIESNLTARFGDQQ